MYVCLCSGATCGAITAAVAGGASTCKQVARACGAGLDCGRCLHNVKALVDAAVAATGGGSRLSATAVAAVG